MERTPIHDAVDSARAGTHPYLISKMESGWLVASDMPFLRGHLVLLSDPVVFSINDLPERERAAYSRDVARAGDALIKILGAYRINYETLCNVAQALHTHIIPRYSDEPEALRRERPVLAYPAATLTKFDPAANKKLISQIREFLGNPRS